jgi:hypothetical protein
MTETTELPPLSPATNASVTGLARAKHEVAQWTHNLEQALADDVAANPPRLTPEQAATVAKANGVEAPPKPGDAAEAKETTAEANQAQLDAQTKANEAAAPKPAPKPKDDDDKTKPKADEKAPASHSGR